MWQHFYTVTTRTIGTKNTALSLNLPWYIFLSSSLFTEAVVCDRDGGRSQVPWKLTIFFPSLQTSVNIYPPLYWNRTLWMHSPEALGFRLCTNEEETPLHKWRWLLTQLKQVMCAKVRHPQLLFVHKPPKGIVDLVHALLWSLWVHVFSILSAFLIFCNLFLTRRKG